MKRCRSLPAAFAAVVVSAVLAACGGDDNNGAGNAPTITTLSNRADLVSGGDVLVEVKMPPVGSASSLKVDVNGTDESSAFTKDGSGRSRARTGCHSA